MKLYDYVIVGAGLFGSVFAHQAHKQGRRCLVIDKRSHLGGNIYSEQIAGINVHSYGAHIFHTSNKAVWDFVNSIVPFNRFTNCPLACFEGKLFNLPFNMNTFHQMWNITRPEEAQAIIEEQRNEALNTLQKEGVSTPRNLEEQALVLVGKDVYQSLIKGYTEKQWGRPCTELPAFIIKRLPVRFIYDNNYFSDKYQGIPIGGWNKLIDGLLEGTETKTNVDFFDDKTYWMSLVDKVVYTGRLDEFYGYSLGKLEYRSLDFQHKVLDTPNYQGNAVVNYTDLSVAYTRIIEHKHFEMFGQQVYECPKTVITCEYPLTWKEGREPYYPVNDSRNEQLANAYRELAKKEEKVIFGGRLAEYKYYDMAPIVEKVLTLGSV